ncbi:MAG: C4-type zinc ribbon domain-containing protein [Bacteroidales bacterium]|nr:C4-type zinc ribbon domain-containing protein [Bacteroidales bacterium]
MATTKKIKRVDTPIDQKETFVSLQKNFADSELSVEEKLKTLYALQAADNAIEKIVQLRGELPSEVAALEDEIDSLKAKEDRISQLVEEFNNAILAAQQDIADNDAEIDRYQKQLANITNSREFDSINKELENLNLLRMISEKNIRESREQIEEKKADIERLEERISLRNEDLEAKKLELENIVESTANEEKQLKATRESCAKKIDERTMSAYERIRASVHNHLAVVSVYNGDSCGGCFNTVTPQRIIEIESGKKLVICEHCGRILVSSEIK